MPSAMTPMNVNGKRKRPNPSKSGPKPRHPPYSPLRPPPISERARAPSSPAPRWVGAGALAPHNQRAFKLPLVGRGRVGSQLAGEMDRGGHGGGVIHRDPHQVSPGASRSGPTQGLKGNNEGG